MNKKLIIGYGNPQRQDDGASWNVIQKSATRFGLHLSNYNDDFYNLLGHNPDFFFCLQLTPEIIDILKDYNEIVFIDTCVGERRDHLEVMQIEAQSTFSTLTHHMSPQFLLSILFSTYHASPKTYLLTIAGSEFMYSEQLSEQTSLLCDQAVEWIIAWCTK
jgi:hydrogenase maturation protease